MPSPVCADCVGLGGGDAGAGLRSCRNAAQSPEVTTNRPPPTQAKVFWLAESLMKSQTPKGPLLQIIRSVYQIVIGLVRSHFASCNPSTPVQFSGAHPPPSAAPQTPPKPRPPPHPAAVARTRPSSSLAVAWLLLRKTTSTSGEKFFLDRWANATNLNRNRCPAELFRVFV